MPFLCLYSKIRCVSFEFKTIIYFLVLLSGHLYKVDITCACLKLDASAASQTVRHTHDILYRCPLRRTTKVSEKFKFKRNTADFNSKIKRASQKCDALQIKLKIKQFIKCYTE